MDLTICILKLSSWRTTRQHKPASVEVAASRGVANDIPRVLVDIADHPALDRLASLHRETYATHRRLSLDSGTENFRLVPPALHPEHIQAMGVLEAKHHREVASVISAYAQIRSDAPRRLQSLFDPAQWPDDIAGEFRFEVKYLPAPAGGPWDEWQKEAAETATAEFRERLVDAARRVLAGVSAGGKLYASTLDTLRTLCQSAADCNLAADPVISELSRAAASVAAEPLDHLRESTHTRAAARGALAAALAAQA